MSLTQFQDCSIQFVILQHIRVFLYNTDHFFVKISNFDFLYWRASRKFFYLSTLILNWRIGGIQLSTSPPFFFLFFLLCIFVFVFSLFLRLFCLFLSTSISKIFAILQLCICPVFMITVGLRYGQS